MKLIKYLIFSTIIFCAMAITALAQGPIFKISTPGYYQLVNGRLIAVQVIDVDAPIIPPIDPPTNPPIDPPSTIRSAVSDSLTKVKESTKVQDASDLTALFKELSIEVKKTSPTITKNQLVSMWNGAGIAYTVSKPTWTDFIKVVGDLISKEAILSKIGDIFDICVEELEKVK